MKRLFAVNAEFVYNIIKKELILNARARELIRCCVIKEMFYV